jgi:hypothetical protein
MFERGVKRGVDGVADKIDQHLLNLVRVGVNGEGRAVSVVTGRRRSSDAVSCANCVACCLLVCIVLKLNEHRDTVFARSNAKLLRNCEFGGERSSQTTLASSILILLSLCCLAIFPW